MNDKILNVALLQLLPTNSLQGNLDKGIAACVHAKKLGADIALFPEMWSSGYRIPENICELKKLALAENSDFVCEFQKLAQELEMAIGITFLEKHEPLPKNTIMLFDCHGKLALKYSKVHTCDFSDEARLSPGEDFFVADIETGIGSVKIGCMICFDREFPESARILMLKGAEVVLAPNACPMEINRLSALALTKIWLPLPLAIILRGIRIATGVPAFLTGLHGFEMRRAQGICACWKRRAKKAFMWEKSICVCSANIVRLTLWETRIGIQKNTKPSRSAELKSRL